MLISAFVDPLFDLDPPRRAAPVCRILAAAALPRSATEDPQDAGLLVAPIDGRIVHSDANGHAPSPGFSHCER